jgi:hypothetical protein
MQIRGVWQFAVQQDVRADQWDGAAQFRPRERGRPRRSITLKGLYRQVDASEIAVAERGPDLTSRKQLTYLAPTKPRWRNW